MMPPGRDDPDLGRLRYDNGVAWYEGEARLAGEAVRLTLSAEDEEDFALSRQSALRLLADGAGWRARAEAAVVDRLLPIKNEHWTDPDEGEVPLTPADFLRALTLESVAAYRDGSVTLHWEDGGTFDGHLVLASIDLDSGAIDADIAG